MNGKEKCKILKEIRAEIAANNDIEWVTSECKHQGDCKGTCPKCESEVRKLERELELKRKLGQNVAVAGVAAGIALAATGCAVPSPVEVVEYLFNHDSNYQVNGDISIAPDDYDGGLALDDTESSDLVGTECTDGTECDYIKNTQMLEGEIELVED